MPPGDRDTVAVVGPAEGDAEQPVGQVARVVDDRYLVRRDGVVEGRLPDDQQLGRTGGAAIEVAGEHDERAAVGRGGLDEGRCEAVAEAADAELAVVATAPAIDDETAVEGGARIDGGQRESVARGDRDGVADRDLLPRVGGNHEGVVGAVAHLAVGVVAVGEDIACGGDEVDIEAVAVEVDDVAHASEGDRSAGDRCGSAGDVADGVPRPRRAVAVEGEEEAARASDLDDRVGRQADDGLRVEDLYRWVAGAEATGGVDAGGEDVARCVEQDRATVGVDRLADVREHRGARRGQADEVAAGATGTVGAQLTVAVGPEADGDTAAPGAGLTPCLSRRCRDDREDNREGAGDQSGQRYLCSQDA